MMNCIVRPLRTDEVPLLSRFLYYAIFVPEGVEAPPMSIIDSPELQVYISDFGTQPHDRALVAEVEGNVVGAVWTRVMNDYGHIADGVPSLAISLLEPFRGQGIGTRLMQAMLAELKANGYDRTSLSVQKANFAYNLYRKVGYVVVGENEEEYIMECQL